MTEQNKPALVSESVFADVLKAENDIAALRGAAKQSNEQANNAKIGAYAVIIAGLSGQQLKKGNLPRAVSNALRKGLLESAGLKEAIVKRYVENSAGALRLLEIPSQATPEIVRDIFAENGIDSENKLAKLVNGEAEKDGIRGLAEALIGKFTTRKDDNGNRVQGVFKPSKFDQDDWDRFHDILSELKAARAAAGDAAVQAAIAKEQENALANEVFQAL